RILNSVGRDLCMARRLAAIVYRFPSMLYRLAARHPSVLAQFGASLGTEKGYPGFVRGLKPLYRVVFWGT
ncbi:hypothetical protein JXA80_08125, partial [bacterium]|nr:hypothetical protein [candidate division CSSED10-310 bacterium]